MTSQFSASHKREQCIGHIYVATTRFNFPGPSSLLKGNSLGLNSRQHTDRNNT